ncbi:MAG: hypothetical protein JRJ84_08550 [Deltaproteobacteria bacterium]|nr:hypothetical protein [Deltaproteobacteria bacterium]
MRSETIAVGVCAGLLVAYLAVVWLDTDPGRLVRLPTAEQVVAVALPSEEDVVLTRAASGWTVSAKGEAPIPAAEVLVDALLAGLAEAAPAPPTHRPEALGAARPVVLSLRDGDSVRIEVGRRRPGGHGCPAEVDGARLDLPSTVDWLLDRPLEGWTRAIVTDLDLADIVGVEVGGSISLEVARTEDGWLVDGLPADPHRVRVWLSYLAHLPALGGAPWDPDADAILEATVALADGTREAVSLACPEGLARTKSGTWRVPGLVCTRLAATRVDLLGAPFLGVEPFGIRLEREGGGWAMERRGSDWVLVEPGDRLLDHNATRLVAEYLADLAPPPVPVGAGPNTFETEATVTATIAEGETLAIAFGAPNSDGLVPVAVDGGPPLYLEQYQVDPVLPRLDELTAGP